MRTEALISQVAHLRAPVVAGATLHVSSIYLNWFDNASEYLSYLLLFSCMNEVSYIYDEALLRISVTFKKMSVPGLYDGSMKATPNEVYCSVCLF